MERYIGVLVLFLCLSIGFISIDNEKQKRENNLRKIIIITEEREIKARLVIIIGNNIIPYSEWMSAKEVAELWRDSDQNEHIRIEYDKIYYCY